MKMVRFIQLYVALVIISTVMTACAKKENEKPTPVRRWQVTCVDGAGKEYYNKVAKNTWNREGSISVQREDDKWDDIMGSCKAEEL
jgi:hypothetical protein